MKLTARVSVVESGGPMAPVTEGVEVAAGGGFSEDFLPTPRCLVLLRGLGVRVTDRDGDRVLDLVEYRLGDKSV